MVGGCGILAHLMQMVGEIRKERFGDASRKYIATYNNRVDFDNVGKSRWAGGKGNIYICTQRKTTTTYSTITIVLAIINRRIREPSWRVAQSPRLNLRKDLPFLH